MHAPFVMKGFIRSTIFSLNILIFNLGLTCLSSYASGPFQSEDNANSDTNRDIAQCNTDGDAEADPNAYPGELVALLGLFVLLSGHVSYSTERTLRQFGVVPLHSTWPWSMLFPKQ